MRCGSPFKLTRCDRKYCSAGCRKRAHEEREEISSPDATEQPLSEPSLRAAIDGSRAVTSGPPLAGTRYLTALALVREAEEMARLWTLRLGIRRNRLLALADPGLAVRLQVVRARHELQPPLPDEEQLGLACGSSELAVVAYGRPRAATNGPAAPSTN